MANGTPISRQSGPPYNLHLKHHLSPGDVLVMTAAVESLHIQYPGQYRTSVDTTCRDIWKHNPRISDNTAHESAIIPMQYPLIHDSNKLSTGHFMNAFVDDLGKTLGIPLKLQVSKPSLYLSAQEKNDRLVDGEYFVVNAGIKTDFTNKNWGRANYQRVVDHFRGRLRFVQIGEAHHLHPALDGVIDFRGKTNARELFQLVHHGLGGLGPTTFLQHIHAALGKFYVCILGGREPLSWVWYPGMTVFSTQGQLDCCKTQACWKSQTVPLGDGDGKDKHNLCVLPVLQASGEHIPACMEAVHPDQVIRAIETHIKYGRKS